MQILELDRPWPLFVFIIHKISFCVLQKNEQPVKNDSYPFWAIRPDDRGLHTVLLSISEGGLSGHGLSCSKLLFLQTFKVM